MRHLLKTAVASIAVLLTVGSSALAQTAPCDALCHRTTAELSVFTKWLHRYHAPGYVGEVGWPDDTMDAAKWDALGRQWFADANTAKLPVTMWATGEWWGSNYRLSVYEVLISGTPVAKDNTQAPVLQANETTVQPRGINDNGGEFGAVSVAPTSTFSNADPGVYNTSYHYDSQATFDYLASQGVKVVRLPFRWERIQPALGHPLDSAEVGRIESVVDGANAAGLKVILDMHNYGGYYLYNGTEGVRRVVGSEQVPNVSFADAWRRISAAFKGRPGVFAYDLMNEPVGLASGRFATPARAWEVATQRAMNAIRSNGDRTLVMVPGYNWSGAQQWTKQHKRPWIKDPAHRFRYEAHHYFDTDNSGNYKLSYDEENAKAQSEGY